MSSSNSPCAACKFLRRKCTQECVFAPYFPPDNPQKFANVHKVFGASNVAKLLNELDASQREDAVYSLAYEAEFRLRDPVYGCVGLISGLQHKLQHIKRELLQARKELATYVGPTALMPIALQQHVLNNPSATALLPMHMQQKMAMPAVHPVPPEVHQGMLGQLAMGNPKLQQQQAQIQQRQAFIEAQQQIAAVAAAREQQQMLRNYEHQQRLQQQQQEEITRFNSGDFDDHSQVVDATGYNQMNSSANVMQPSLALGGYYEHQNNYQQIPQDGHQEQQPHQQHHYQEQQPEHHRQEQLPLHHHHQEQQPLHHQQEHPHLAQSLQLEPQMMLNQQQAQQTHQHHHLQQRTDSSEQQTHQYHHLQQRTNSSEQQTHQYHHLQQRTNSSEEGFSGGGPSC